MADRAGTLEQLVTALARVLVPVGHRLSDGQVFATFEALGVAFPDELLTQAGVTTARNAIEASADALGPALENFSTEIAGGDAGAIVAAGLDVLDQCATLIASFDDLATQLNAAVPSLPGISAAQIAELTTDFGARLLDLLVATMADLVPAVGSSLTALGLIQRTPRLGVPGDPTKPEFDAILMRYDRLGPLFTSPSSYFQSLYQWGDPGFDGSVLLGVLHQVLSLQDFPAALIPTTATEPLTLETLFADVTPTQMGSPPGLQATVLAPLSATFTRTSPIGDSAWSVTVTATGEFVAGVLATVRPPLEISVKPLAGTFTGSGLIELGASPAEPFVLLGQTSRSRLEVASVTASAGVTLTFDALSGEASAEPVVGGDLTGVKVVIDTSSGDGFITQLLSGLDVTANFDLGFSWSMSGGLRFRGSSAIEIELPVNLSLGSIGIPTIYLSAGFRDDAFPFEISASLAARLGPIQASIDRLGAVATLSFPDGGGNVGPAQLTFAFKPPTALGIAVDAGPIKGGGFLDFDPANERYEGILQLSFGDLFTMTAIGLITTRMPDGSPGFSLLIIISAEFQPIQLGFGFTLNGVGGLLGLHRSVVVDALREGIKNDRVDDIMFPEDPIANAPRLLSDLRTIFPARQDQFLVGPMAKLGWGTPTLITAELAIIVELPDPVRIVLLGVLKINLPDEDAAILRLQVNFLGVLDFEAGELSFEANLYDSRLLTLTLSGGMAFRINWGDNPGFLMSVGGFHPAYDPPDARLPDIDRLTLSLLPGNNPRLTLEAYFAVTSNTVQFGARIELYAGVSKFNVYGWLGFDALFQFDPFMFIVEVSAGLAVRIGGSPILSVSVKLTLKGPTPYNAIGNAKFKILFFTFKVKFNKTWGETRDTSLPAVEVLPLVLKAMADPGNWEALPPARTLMLVITKAVELPDDEVAVHPLGSLTVRQKVAPLGVTIEKFGSGKVAGDNRFDAQVMAAGEVLDSTQVRDEFAPAQFFDLSDSDKLSRASFEQLQSGLTVGAPDDMEAGNVVPRLVAYEQIIIDAHRRKLPALVTMSIQRFRMFLRGGSMARSDLAQAVRPAGSELSPSKVAVATPGYTVVGIEDLAPVDGAEPLSQTEAIQHMEQLMADEPGLADRLQVLPTFEVAGV